MDPSVIAAMTSIVSHRGPDGSGTNLLAVSEGGVRDTSSSGSQNWNVALGHRRLSILDLSDAGRQPMCWRNRLWITYNGEVYNYLELRAELQRCGHQFSTGTDTEVILAAYDQWGTDCFARLRGMWGLAIVDGPRQRLVVSRDRLGIKPLYAVSTHQCIAFVSEIKQLTALPGFHLKANDPVVQDYLKTGYERENATFFENVLPVPPGMWQEFDLASRKLSSPVAYWHPERIEPAIDDADEASRLFRDALQDATRVHLRSDVPVGCALSGGLDSSSIACCVSQMLNGGTLETFTVAFPGAKSDETHFAQQIIRNTTSSSHFVTPTPEQLVGELDRFTWIHDEPVGGLPQFAAYCLARLTRESGVPVTLNGQGGDEVLAGYWQSYFMHLLTIVQSGRWHALCPHLIGSVLPGGNPEILRQAPIMLRRYLARRRASSSNGVPSNSGHDDNARVKLQKIVAMNEQERRVYEIRHLYLPRLLKWDDRNFMAFSVEGRYPFLDHPLIELALSFSPNVLYSRGWAKEPLRRGLHGVVPQSVLRRRTKFGFETPQDDWLCNALRPLIESWLSGDSPIWRLVTREAARELANKTWQAQGRRDEPGQELLRLMLADRWMRVFSLN